MKYVNNIYIYMYAYIKVPWTKRPSLQGLGQHGDLPFTVQPSKDCQGGIGIFFMTP